MVMLSGWHRYHRVNTGPSETALVWSHFDRNASAVFISRILAWIDFSKKIQTLGSARIGQYDRVDQYALKNWGNAWWITGNWILKDWHSKRQRIARWKSSLCELHTDLVLSSPKKNLDKLVSSFYRTKTDKIS
jgi:hypothetical protein